VADLLDPIWNGGRAILERARARVVQLLDLIWNGGKVIVGRIRSRAHS
jgi:hypothetical protein